MTERLDTNYATAGYHHRLGFGMRPALVLIDFVQAYFEPSSPFYAGVEDALAAALRVLDAARKAGILVIFTNVQFQAAGLDGGVFFRKVPNLKAYLPGSTLGRFPDGLVPRPNEPVVSKQYASAFFGTSLAATLTAARVDTVLLTGLTTSGCVRASCVDAMQHGFIPIVVREACGDRHPAPHEANLFDMDAKYADVVSEAEVVAFLHRPKS
ncbi:MAG: isochorismatase family protein [Acetobacteraceae bacterium]